MCYSVLVQSLYLIHHYFLHMKPSSFICQLLALVLLSATLSVADAAPRYMKTPDGKQTQPASRTSSSTLVKVRRGKSSSSKSSSGSSSCQGGACAPGVDTPKTADTNQAVGSSSVAKALAKLAYINTKPDMEAEYYVYLMSASWCPYCRLAMPVIVGEYGSMRGEKVEVVLFSSDSTAADASNYLKQHGANFPTTMNSVASMPGNVPSGGIPHVTLVDKNGTTLASGHPNSVIPQWRQLISKDKLKKNSQQSDSTCTGDDCEQDDSTCTGDDCKQDDNSCTGDDCKQDDSTCTGDNCTQNTEKTVPSDSPVAKALAKLSYINTEPNSDADYYVYLQSASWCGYCRMAMPTIVGEYAAMKEENMEIVLFSADSTAAAAANYLNQYGADFPATMAYASSVPGSVRTNGIPHMTIVDKNGTTLAAGHPNTILPQWRTIIAKEKIKNKSF